MRCRWCCDRRNCRYRPCDESPRVSPECRRSKPARRYGRPQQRGARRPTPGSAALRPYGPEHGSRLRILHVLGGNAVMRDGDFHGEKIHNTLMTDQEIAARERRVNPRTIGVPNLRGGEQRLDVRFVQFDNVVLELLQYRDAQQPMGSGDSWAEPRDHMSPAYPRSLHISFYIRGDVDFNKFIHDLEAEST